MRPRFAGSCGHRYGLAAFGGSCLVARAYRAIVAARQHRRQ